MVVLTPSHMSGQTVSQLYILSTIYCTLYAILIQIIGFFKFIFLKSCNTQFYLNYSYFYVLISYLLQFFVLAAATYLANTAVPTYLLIMFIHSYEMCFYLNLC